MNLSKRGLKTSELDRSQISITFQAPEYFPKNMFSQPLKVLFALLFLHITPSITVPLSDFYPYGVSEGDTALPANDDGSSGEISISILFPYFDRNHDSLFVSKMLYLLFEYCKISKCCSLPLLNNTVRILKYAIHFSMLLIVHIQSHDL